MFGISWRGPLLEICLKIIMTATEDSSHMFNNGNIMFIDEQNSLCVRNCVKNTL
jgi:hypothetical protein